MILIGHLGITLFFCAPLANVLVTSGYRNDVPRWVGIALVVTLLPDSDLFLPWFTHRGVTHSLVAAVCLGVIVAVGVSAVRSGNQPTTSTNRVRRAVLGFTVGAGGIVSHLVGDVLTPMGVRPFVPVDSVYSLNLVYAKDIGANLSFMTIGVVVFLTVYCRSNDPVPTDEPMSSELAADSEISPFNP